VPSPLNYTGAYSWFLTVTPMVNVPRRFTVSVVVCFGRNLTLSGERAVTVTNFYDTAKVNGESVAIGGGSLQLQRQINDIPSDETNNPPSVAGINLKENDWVALYSGTTGLCRWYRVASIGDNTQYVTLIGPDWASPTANSDKVIALGQSVVGVYTTTIDLDTDPTWTN